MDEKVNNDLGWQRPTATSRKFHYFVNEKPYNNWQRSLCGQYGFPGHFYIDPDIDPPNDESCKRCATKWRGTYGDQVRV